MVSSWQCPGIAGGARRKQEETRNIPRVSMRSSQAFSSFTPFDQATPDLSADEAEVPVVIILSGRVGVSVGGCSSTDMMVEYTRYVYGRQR